jgi:hypothetical protein
MPGTDSSSATGSVSPLQSIQHRHAAGGDQSLKRGSQAFADADNGAQTRVALLLPDRRQRLR